MMATEMATDRSREGGTHAAGVRRPRSGSTGEGGGIEEEKKRNSSSQEDKIGPVDLKKIDYSNNRDGKGIHRWSSLNDDRAKDDANNGDIRERGVTATDNGDNGGNGK